ncbi:MAG: UDP-N-acetylmuramate--L-alanine ligase [Bacilli bacterium]
MKYFLIAVKGSGMSSLAVMLKKLGYDVSGSDGNPNFTFTQEILEKENIKIYNHDEENIKKDMVIIYSAAVKDTNVERIKAKNLGLIQYSYPEFIGKLTKEYKTISVSGCHGKTSTSSLLAHVLNASIGCNYLIGDSTSHIDKNSNLFVLESCEYKRHFLNYFPTYTIITNIDLDHVDYFKDISDVIDAYDSFIAQTSNKVIALGDDKNVRKLKNTDKILYYGLKENNDIYATNIITDKFGCSFDVFIKSEFYKNFNLEIYGMHSILNALAVISVCYLQNIEPKTIEYQINTFTGAKRRFNEEMFKDIVTIDDYGHHPVEIKATIDSIKQKYFDKELVIIFEGHTFSRVNFMKKEFIEVLKQANKVYVMDIYNGSREENTLNLDYTILTNEIAQSEYINMDTVDKLSRHKNSVIVLFSARNNELLEKFKNSLKY